MNFYKLHRLFIMSYFVVLFLFSVFCFLNLISIRIGILKFQLIILVLVFLYSFLFQLNSQFFSRYFYLLSAYGTIIKILLSFSDPLWEDDWARFLWEGQLIVQRISPYLKAPDFFYNSNLIFENPTKANEILSRVNHPDWTPIYFPLIELYFFLCAKISSYSLSVLKLGYLLFDFGILIILKRMRNHKTAVLFFLFPILIKETFLTAHFEIISIFLILLSFLFFEKKRLLLSSFFLGLALHSKIYLIVLLPYFFIRIFQLSISIPFFLMNLLFILFGFSLPFLLFQILIPENGTFGMEKILQFSNIFEFNSLIFYLMKLFLNHQISKIVCNSILVLFLIYSAFQIYTIPYKKRQEYLWIYFVFLFSLELSPIANPWYFLILLPFCFLAYPSLKSMWIIILIPQLAYLTNTNLGLGSQGFYNISEYIIALEIVLLFLLQWDSISKLDYRKKIRRNSIVQETKSKNYF